MCGSEDFSRWLVNMGRRLVATVVQSVVIEAGVRSRGNARRSARITGRSARLNSLNHPVNESTHLGRYSLSYLLGHLDLDDLPNHAPRSFHKRKFVRQAALQQHADAIVAGYIRCCHQRCVLCNAKVSQVDGLYQDEQVLCGWVLYLGEFPAKILHKDVMESGFALQNPLEGYRRLTFMMLDAGVVAVSPASVWRVLKQAGLLSQWKRPPSRKGKGFEQPLQPYQHWHIDISYINLCGTFYYLCSVLDGFSRFLMHWDLRESMREADVEVILERAKEKYPEAKPRIISDNCPQFIALDFKEFIRISGMTHVRTSPYYPQSNGKLERWHKSLKSECIRPGTPLSPEDAKRLIQQYVDRYNNVRLHSAIGYVTPNDMLAGRQAKIHAERDRKLEAARLLRKSRRQQAA
jgi:putative transposase